MALRQIFKDIVRIVGRTTNLEEGSTLLTPEGVASSELDASFFVTMDTSNTELERDRVNMLLEHDVTVVLLRRLHPQRPSVSQLDILEDEENLIEAMLHKANLPYAHFFYTITVRGTSPDGSILRSDVSFRCRHMVTIDSDMGTT